MDRVLAEDERRRDLAVRQAGGDESQDLGLAHAERGVAVRLGGRRVAEEADERSAKRPLIVHPGDVCVAVDGDEAGVRQEAGDLTAVRDRDGAVSAAVQDEGRRLDVGEEFARVRRQIEVEERRRDLGRRRVPVVPAQRLDRVAVGPREHQPGQHLGRERPVRPDEVDQRAARRLRDVRPRDVAPEEDEFLHPLGREAREPGGRHAGARAGEQRDPALAARVEHRGEDTRLRLDGGRARRVPVRQAGSHAVVADDAMRTGEFLEEAPRVRIIPFLLEMRHPPSAEEQRRAFPDRRVRDPAAVELAEADLLLH